MRQALNRQTPNKMGSPYVRDQLNILLKGENQDLGIVKRQRKPNVKLIIAPFPDKQRGSDQFFFQPSSKTPLTTVVQA